MLMKIVCQHIFHSLILNSVTFQFFTNFMGNICNMAAITDAPDIKSAKTIQQFRSESETVIENIDGLRQGRLLEKVIRNSTVETSNTIYRKTG